MREQVEEPHEPTPERRGAVEAMAGFGVSDAEIAAVLKIDEATLAEFYSTELELGATKANAKVAENLFKIATGTSKQAAAAAMFWMQARGGWSKTAPRDVLSPKDRPAVPRKPQPKTITYRFVDR